MLRSYKPGNERRKSQLTAPRQRLLELMQQVNFGRIEGLVVRDGEPVLDNAPASPRVVLEVKFGGDNGPRPEISISDFAVKSQVVELFATLDRLGNARVESLTVKHGLPFGMQVEARV